MDKLLQIKLPRDADASTRQCVHAAVDKFRRRSSTKDYRRDAVRDLGDVLEPLRKHAKARLGSDDSHLFQILNQFGIRHNNETQKTKYDPKWLSGLF